MTPSEAFIYALSRSTFLNLWTYPNPLGKDLGKELCDILVVCVPDVVVISVKDVELKSTGDPAVQQSRWWRRAVEESVSQIAGAERRIQQMETVTAADGTEGVSLGSLDSRRIHRIAAAIGAKGSIPLQSDDFGHGFVHVFDDRDIFFLLNEMNTIEDALQYLTDREEFLKRAGIVIIGTEPDLLATYISNNRHFPAADVTFADISRSWERFSGSTQYRRRVEEDEVSYVWDRLITQLHDDYAADNYEFGGELYKVDTVTRMMARETRFNRRGLGAAFKGFIDEPELRARTTQSPSGTGYVFLKTPHGENRRDRTAELTARVVVVRDTMPEPRPVVGIATEVYEKGKGYSLDVMMIDVPKWTVELQEKARQAREEFGFFKNPRMSRQSYDEFPFS